MFENLLADADNLTDKSLYKRGLQILWIWGANSIPGFSGKKRGLVL
jgi:hypothetical protein